MSKETVEDLEKEKLRLEIEDLQRPLITRPGSWFSAVTVLVAIGGMIGQNILSDIKIQREALKAEQTISEAKKRVASAESREKDAEAKADTANIEKMKAVRDTESLRWEAVALSKEKLALEEQTATAREGLKIILAKVQDIKNSGIDNKLISNLESAISETESKLSYCTPEEAAVYDKALPLDEEQSELAKMRHLPWGIPKQTKIISSFLLLSQPWWIGGYDQKLKVPRWVSYRLDGSSILKMNRKNCWRPDPRVNEKNIAKREDFARSGYDRGHLVPRADMTRSELSAASVYIYSNIAPQEPVLNRRFWSYLERQVREWATNYGSVYVISGAIFDWDKDGKPDEYDIIKKIGLGKVAIPSHYYKIITRVEFDKPTHLLAFLLSNRKDFSSSNT